MPGFAVVDFQTTGLAPKKHDRIVEVAITHLDRAGGFEGQWETVVNPGRDVEPPSGLTRDEIAAAPTFSQILPPLAYLLNGRVLVAHNASFHTGFLLAELKRAGYRTPQTTVLCTMQLAGELLPESGRSLHECCAICGIALVDPQRAWLVVAMASTLAGNFTLLGSVANLIVAQRAAKEGIEIDFWSYFRVGAPLTLITIAIGIIILS